MRTSLLLAFVAVLAVLPAALAGTGSMAIYADSACAINLFTTSFTSGQCETQSSGGKNIYFITTCDGNNWTGYEYSDAACTTVVAGSKTTGTSGTCFASGSYYDQVTCPSSAAAEVEESAELFPSLFQNSAASTMPSMVAVALAAIAAIFA